MLQLFSADGSVDTAFVNLFPTAYEIASCKLLTLLCIGCLPVTLIKYLSFSSGGSNLACFCGSSGKVANFCLRVNTEGSVGVTPQQSASRVIFRTGYNVPFFNECCFMPTETLGTIHDRGQGPRSL